jgi:predicted RNA-binding protein YlqC (UPF0109 family)/ribosomal 30S subunit maturation factor RimM
MRTLIEYCARNLVDRPEEVQVEEHEDGETTVLTLYVAPGDLGKVIGREGRTAESASDALLEVAARPKGGRRSSRLPTEGGGEAILVGVIAKAHGLAGEVVVEVWSDAPARFAPGSELTARERTAARAGWSWPPPVRSTVASSCGSRGSRIASKPKALRGLELTIDRAQAAPLPRERTTGSSWSASACGTARAGVGNRDRRLRDGEQRRNRGARRKRGLLLPALPGVVLEVAMDRGELIVEVPPGAPRVARKVRHAHLDPDPEPRVLHGSAGRGNGARRAPERFWTPR